MCFSSMKIDEIDKNYSIFVNETKTLDENEPT